MLKLSLHAVRAYAEPQSGSEESTAVHSTRDVKITDISEVNLVSKGEC